ncbi:hypothetical protein OB955_00095 [Halobacteria archaeon AArc-m2/3/4]|uniref:Uncharacterized protein n=1 Tax=Natronoglomus mannanivorans TaxID=2979990 RepID=A0ABT2Q891_9EURY|nr:hypothetical protein [Halobacteria archaeon AArc-m2/3/4]
MAEHGDECRWEEAGKRATAMLLGGQATTVTEISIGIEETLHHGETPSTDDIVALRMELLTLQWIVEECLVPYESNLDAWDQLDELPNKDLERNESDDK